MALTKSQFSDIKKIWDTYDLRAEDNSLTVDAAYDELRAAEVRAQRDALLKASDWTQLPDSPVDTAAWATYRQALRDLPTAAGFPTSFVMPTAPA